MLICTLYIDNLDDKNIVRYDFPQLVNSDLDYLIEETGKVFWKKVKKAIKTNDLKKLNQSFNLFIYLNDTEQRVY